MVDDPSLPELPRRLPFVDNLIAAVLASGFGAPVLATVGAMGAVVGGIFSAGGVLLVLPAWFGLIWATRKWVRANRPKAVQLLEILVLGILPAWGLLYNHLASGSCVTNACDSPALFRPFAEPEIFALLGGHALACLAYVVSRVHERPLSALAECLVAGLMLFAIPLEILVEIQLGPWLLGGVALAPVLLPAIGPAITVILFVVELRSRLRRRGLEAAERERARLEEKAEADLAYRAPVAEPLPPVWARVDRTILARALALSPALVGLYAVIHSAWLGNPASALQVVTRTCDYTLSQLQVVVLPADCHYLCTVAARGHAGLVKPLRVGRRGGIPIVVNRQLALANAFEDLLHERWPRFGRFARKVYDRLGWPLSRRIQSRWASDLVYLAMKPAEWIFYLSLLILDRKPPEERIDRMYR